MHDYLMEMVECPACHGGLDWRIEERAGERIETAEAKCAACGAAYPVRDGIGLFLTPDLPRNDLWEEVDSGLVRHLRAKPALERRLLDGAGEGLNAADLFLRALLLEARGEFEAAKTAEAAAFEGMYTADYLNCWHSQVEYVLAAAAEREGPVVDLASGRGYLVERLAREMKRPVVATDFSPGVLRRNRVWLQEIGLYEGVSLLAFDARRTPFKDGAVGTMTTNLGLPNIEEPGSLLRELRRVVSGVFLGISHFYPEEDAANGNVIGKAGLDMLLYRRLAEAAFEEAGWPVEVRNRCVGAARPTPESELLEGVRIDGLPVMETVLEWGVLWGSE